MSKLSEFTTEQLEKEIKKREFKAYEEIEKQRKKREREKRVATIVADGELDYATVNKLDNNVIAYLYFLVKHQDVFAPFKSQICDNLKVSR